MDSERSRIITGHVFRNGQEPPPEERINAVWTLTIMCLGWNQEEFIEPRLDKSVVRIKRAKG